MRKMASFERGASIYYRWAAVAAAGALTLGVSACGNAESTTNPFANDQAALQKTMRDVTPGLIQLLGDKPAQDDNSGFVVNGKVAANNPAATYTITVRTRENLGNKPPMNIANPNVDVSEVSILLQSGANHQFLAEVSLDERAFTANGQTVQEYTVGTASDIPGTKPVEAVDDKDIANIVALTHNLATAAEHHTMYTGP